MGNHEQDMRYLAQRLTEIEQDLAAAKALQERHSDETQLGDLVAKLERDSENISYVYKRDRINRGKPK